MPADKLTFGGASLLFDDQATAQDFLDRYQPLEELALHGPHVGTLGSRTSSYGQTRQIGLPLPNYPPYPKPRINDLYWPTGAARWAIGYFLVDSTGLAILNAGSSTEQAAKTLKANDGTNSLQCSLYLLTAVPITCPAGGNNLWLLVLVDERYFWQYASAGDPDVDAWDQMLTALAGRVSATIDQDAVEAAYLIPDPDEMTRRYDNAALMLDAVAHCCGQRIVRQLDGTIRSMNAAGAEAQYQLNQLGDYRQSAGGLLASALPASLEVAFPRLVGCCWNGEYYTVTKSASDYVAQGTRTVPFTVTIHDTAWADGASGTPANSATLDSLAGQIATDYYAWLRRRYDRTFNGINLNALSGYDDAVTFSFGQMLERTPEPIVTPDGATVHAVLDRRFEPRYFTRIRTLPLNFGVDQLCHQDSGLDLPERAPGCERGIAALTATLTQGSSASAAVMKINSSGTLEYTGDTITLWDWQLNATESVPSGTKLEYFWQCDRYLASNPYCAASDTLPA